MKRPEYSVVLINRSNVFRLDFRGKYAQEAGELQQAELGEDSGLLDAVRHVLSGGQPLGRNTIVLSTGIWNQLIEIPRLSLSGVDELELENALRYEAETLVGQAADEIALGAVPIGGDDTWSRYWINVASQAEWDEVTVELMAAGARHVWFSHPSGLSIDRRGKSGRPHVECWDNQVAHFAANGDMQAVSNSGVRDVERWVADLSLRSWQDLSERCTVVTGPGQTMAADQPRPKHLVELSDQAALRNWMQSVAKSLLLIDQGRWPVIAQQKKAVHPLTQWLAKAAVLMAIILFCVWHWTWLNQRSRSIADSIQSVQQLADEKNKFDSLLRGVIEQREKVAVEAARTQLDLHNVQFLVEKQTDRFSQLLHLLVGLRPDDMVVRQISPHEKGTVLSGVSLTSEAASTMAKSLRPLALPLGWKTHPAMQQGEKKMVNGGPWTFSILLEDIGPGISLPVDAPAPRGDRMSNKVYP